MFQASTLFDTTMLNVRPVVFFSSKLDNVKVSFHATTQLPFHTCFIFPLLLPKEKNSDFYQEPISAFYATILSELYFFIIHDKLLLAW